MNYKYHVIRASRHEANKRTKILGNVVNFVSFIFLIAVSVFYVLLLYIHI